MPALLHGDGQRFAPEPGQEVPIAEQLARLKFVITCVDFQRKKVLDCGCGTGYSLEFLVSTIPTARYIGIDKEGGAVDYARKRYPHMDFITMDGELLGFRSESFDMALSFEVLEHLLENDQERYINEIYRILKPGGNLVLSTPNRKIFSMGYRKSLNPYHVRELELSELYILLSGKFKNIDVYGQYFHNTELRWKDSFYLRKQFSSMKRIERFIGRGLKKRRIFYGVHLIFRTIMLKRAHKQKLYPFMVTPEDFAFDKENVQISKWFLCVCRK